MKRITACILALVLICALAACGAKPADEPVAETKTTAETVVPPELTDVAQEAGTSEKTDADVPTQTMTGWDFKAGTGTLYLNEPQYLEKTPYTGNLSDVKAVELSGSVTEVSAQTERYDGLGVYPELRKIVLGDSVRKLDEGAFNSCFKTERIVLGRGVREISENAFFGSEYGEGSIGCTGLRKIEVKAENPYFTVEDDVLFNKDRTELILYPMCREKTEYTVPDSVRKINWFAFCCNQTLRGLTVGKGIKSIEFSLFGCNALRELVLPDTLRSIGDSTVKYCGLQSVRIPDSVTTLGLEAFSNCPNLETVHIGSGVKLAADADTLWFNSPVLREVTVDAGNPSLCTMDGAVFSKDQRTLFVYPCGSTREEYTVPDGTRTIAYNAFCENEHLKRVYVPASVTEIDASNFCITDYEGGGGTTYPFEVWYGGSAQQWNEAVADSGGTDGLTVHYNAAAIG